MAKIYRGPELIKPPDVSIGQYLYKNLKSFGNKNAIVCGVTGQKVSYAELLDHSLRLAAAFRDLGIQEGDYIGFSSENTIDFYPVVIATFFVGAIIAPINPTYVERELEHCLSISVPRLVVCSPLVASRVEPVVSHMVSTRKLPSKARCVVTGSKDMLGLPSTHQLVAKVTNIEGLPVFSHQAAHKTSFVMCSSGTTGLPKGVELTNKNILTCIAYFHSPDIMDITSTDCLLGLLPCFHMYGLTMGLVTLSFGASLVLLPKFEEKLFLSSIQNYKINIAFLVPPLIIFLGKHPLVDQYDLSSLREIWCGAAPLSREVQEAATKRLGRDLIRQGYGLTEATLAVTVNPLARNKFGSSGKVVPGMLCKVLDRDTGEILGPGKTGELCFRGDLVMKGYKDNTKATDETVDNAGWVHTGDVGYFDQDEFLFVVDRVKELIKVKGFQVAPAELEALLLTHSDIQDSAVIGIPDEKAGELPLAFVVVRPGAELSEKQVFDFIAKQVSSAKRLSGGIKFVSSIPKTASGKILRRKLREQMKKAQSKL